MANEGPKPPGPLDLGPAAPEKLNEGEQKIEVVWFSGFLKEEAQC